MIQLAGPPKAAAGINPAVAELRELAEFPDPGDAVHVIERASGASAPQVRSFVDGGESPTKNDSRRLTVQRATA